MIIVVIILYQLLITVNNTDTLNFQIRYYNFGKILQIWSSHMAQMLDSEEFWRISEQVPLTALTIISVPLTFWDIYFMSLVNMLFFAMKMISVIQPLCLHVNKEVIYWWRRFMSRLGNVWGWGDLMDPHLHKNQGTRAKSGVPVLALDYHLRLHG